MSFDGTAYRKSVLTTLRDANPAQVEDLFWLAHVPREADDDAEIAEALKATRGFLFKERTRARQAAVAQAVLGEWPRIEATLLDAAARAALRRRLEQAGDAAPVAVERPKPAPAGGDRRRRQVSAGLAELARLRDDPDLGHDLFAFLGLPTSATREMLRARIEKIAEVNRRRRPDRERALTDDLLAHARKLLLDGDPAAYLAGFDDEFRDRVVDALLAGDVDAARTALGTARARGVSDAAILARLEAARNGGAASGAAATPIPLSALGLGTLCPVCDTVASPGATTCATCHSPLTVRCESCMQHVAADLVRCSNCGALLEDARAPLLARREETDALAAVDAAPPEQREAQLRALVRAHPEWARAQRRLATLPPGPPRNVRLAIEHNEALVSWDAAEGVDAYLVERHGPQGSRVLGRTSMLEWTDSAPSEPGITWTVRALRGQNASSAPVTAASDAPEPEPEPDTPGVKDLAAIAGRPVVLSWRAPEGAKLTLTRRRDDVTRTISPDHDGYVDRKVQAGATYEYTVALDGVEGSERSTTVTVPSDAPAAAPGAPAVSELVVRRRDDGRVEATWTWPEGTTEVFVAWDRTPPTSATSAPGGRKITNTRYQIDGGAALDGVPAGAHIAVFTGTRSAAGTLEWSVDAPPTARRLVP